MLGHFAGIAIINMNGELLLIAKGCCEMNWYEHRTGWMSDIKSYFTYIQIYTGMVKALVN